jgi:hypothetical protein
MRKFLKIDHMICLIAVFFPLSILALNWKIGFTTDWYNNLWMIGYQGKYLLHHFSFPAVYNTQHHTGIVFPLFYGYLLYPALGILSSALGPHIALRVGLFLIFIIQFSLVKNLTFKLTRDIRLSWLTATLITWAIYPLTNIYNRNAIGEFFSSTALTSAFCLWFLVLLENQKLKKHFLAFAFICMSIFMAGSHSITAFLGMIALGLVIMVSAISCQKQNLNSKTTLFIILLGFGSTLCLSLSPWILVMLKFYDQVKVSSSLGVLNYIKGIDETWIRAFPLPLDYRFLQSGLSISTPGLDAQFNFPLLILILFQLYLLLKKVNWKTFLLSKQGISFGICLSIFLCLFLVSVIPNSDQYFEGAFQLFQFSFRLVTYQNLALFLSFICLNWIPYEMTDQDQMIHPELSASILTLAGCGVILKLLHASLLFPLGSALGYPQFETQQDEEFTLTPKSFHSAYDYNVSSHLTPLKPEFLSGALQTYLPILHNDKFGMTGQFSFDLPNTAWVMTSVFSFPWNQIEVNGEILKHHDLAFGNQRLVFKAHKAGSYQLRYHFTPDPIWVALRYVSLVTIMSLLLCLLYFWRRSLRENTRLIHPSESG